MQSQIMKWLNEPKLSCFSVNFEVLFSLLFSKFNSVGLDVLPVPSSCFIWVLIIFYIINRINKLRLEEIVIKTKNLEYREKEKEVFDKLLRPSSIPKEKKKKVKKG